MKVLKAVSLLFARPLLCSHTQRDAPGAQPRRGWRTPFPTRVATEFGRELRKRVDAGDLPGVRDHGPTATG